MEQVNQNTPSKVHKCDSPLINNPWVYRTPVKQNEIRLKRTTYRNNTQCLPFTVLPSHITPPSKLNKFIIKNPFEPDLINRLHLPVISPTVFTKVSSSAQRSPGFTWNIDELARIQPARIEEFPKQQLCSPDPELEVKAQAAIDRFFTENQIIPSPWDVRQKENKPYIPLDTPNRLLDDLNSTKELSRSTKDVWSQTILSLPFVLPQNVEEALKPFFTFTQEQNTDSDDINLSNNSLRRKLFFNRDEHNDNDNDSVVFLSPVKMSESMILSCSPPQSGMFAHDTPLKRQVRRQSDEISVVKSKNLSPPDMSPICNIKNDTPYERVEHCSHSATRLDLSMDMSVDNVPIEKNQNLVNGYHSLDTFLGENNVKRMEDNNKLIIVDNDKTNVYDSVDIKKIPKHKNSTDSIVCSDAVVFNDKNYNGTSLKIATKVESFMHESHKQSNIMSGTSDLVQNISNSVQDTGYQTYSMNSTMQHTIDSCNNILTQNHKIHWNEQIVICKDNDQLSWRENMGNVFSSTPSRCNKKDES